MLSERAKLLLAMEEGHDVDFKLNRSGVKPDDIVAFANLPTGGAILAGVEETTNANGRQVGVVVGCNIGDGEKLAILDVANSCIPPVQIEVFEEEFEGKAFYRIEIPSGPNKPYSTRKGVYSIRGDGRNNPLAPHQLLNLYLDIEGGQFLDRFRNATEDLSSDIERTQLQLHSLRQNAELMIDNLRDDLRDTTDSVASISEQVDKQLEQVFDSVKSTANQVDDTASASENILSALEDLDKRLDTVEGFVSENCEILNVLLAHFEIEHPRITRQRKIVQELTKYTFKTFGSRERVLEVMKGSVAADPSLVEQWVDEALEQIGERAKR